MLNRASYSYREGCLVEANDKAHSLLLDRFRKRYAMQNVIARNGVVARRSRSKPEKIPHFVRNRLRISCNDSTSDTARNNNKPVNVLMKRYIRRV